MQITKEQREQHIFDMKSLIADNRKQKKRFPKDSEFAELCGISINCSANYRKIILQRNTIALTDRFDIEKIQSIEDSLDTFNKHIEWYETIRKDEEENISIRMDAAKLIEEAQKHITEVMIDSPSILPGGIIDEDNVLFNKEQLHGTEEKITAGIKSISN